MSPVTRLDRLPGRILSFVIWEISARSTWINKTKMAQHKSYIFHDYRSFVDSCNFTNKANSSKLCPFGRPVAKAKLICQRLFFPVSGLELSYGKLFIPVAEIRDLGNRASLLRRRLWARHMLLPRLALSRSFDAQENARYGYRGRARA